MTEAIQNLLKPLWEQTRNDETLDEFCEAFFAGGGEVNVKIPEWLKARMGLDETEETVNNDPNIIGPQFMGE